MPNSTTAARFSSSRYFSPSFGQIGKLPGQFAYSFEGIGQTGHMGLVEQRAYAWFAGVTRPVTVLRKALDLPADRPSAGLLLHRGESAIPAPRVRS